MEKQAYRRTLDLQKTGTQWCVDEKWCDTNSRKIIISLTDGGKPFVIDDDINVTVYSSTGLYIECKVESGVVIFEPTRKFLFDVGTVNCELRLVSTNSSGAQLLTSPKFDVEIYDVLADEGAIVDSDNYSALTTQTARSIEATNRANNIAQTLEDKLANGELKGDKGDKGDTGEQGIQGEKGDRGPTGFQGPQGKTGNTGPQGIQGEKGDTGATGADGKSAYQVAVANGFDGTQTQWLESLKGDKGDKGDIGEQGMQGVQGEKGDKGDPGTTDYTKLTNNPITLITTEEFDAKNLEDGHTYLIACKNGTRISFGGTLSYGSRIIIDGNSATLICGQGTFFIPDINDTDYWGLADYCPALSEVESMISSIDMTDIDISQALVKFKSIDNDNLSLTLKEFAETMMQYFQTYDEQISAKQNEIQLGDGLKWLNGKLTLDIPDGDNLKYGTQAVETNEVTENE